MLGKLLFLAASAMGKHDHRDSSSNGSSIARHSGQTRELRRSLIHYTNILMGENYYPGHLACSLSDEQHDDENSPNLNWPYYAFVNIRLELLSFTAFSRE